MPASPIRASLRYPDPAFKECDLFLVRLTDSALRDLENLSTTLGEEKFKMSFTGNQSSISLPLSNGVSNFTMNLSTLSNSGNGLVDCMVFNKGKVRCAGKVTARMTVNAKEDSFSLVKEKMIEEGCRKSQTKQLNSKKPCSFITAISDHPPKTEKLCSSAHSTDYISGRTSIATSVNPSCNAFANSLCFSNGSGPSPPPSNPAIIKRSLRERVVHILALRRYERPELLVRLSRDGLTQEQIDNLDSVLSEIGRVDRRSSYGLISSALADLDENWPGLTTDEKNRILTLKFNGSTLSPATRVQTTPPTNSSYSTQSDDQCSRRPTRANLPAAPHALSKKIAALDLIATGVRETDVASRLGVTCELLGKWRASETEIRERHDRRQIIEHPGLQLNPRLVPPYVPSISVQSFRDSGISIPPHTTNQSGISSSQKRIRPVSPTTNLVNSSHPIQNGPSKPRKSKKLSSITPSVCGGTDLDASTDEFMPMISVHGNSRSISPSLPDSISHTLYGQSRPHQFMLAGGGGGTGSEGESAAHTPYSNVSSDSSAHANTAAGSRYICAEQYQLRVETTSIVSDTDDSLDSLRTIRHSLTPDLNAGLSQLPMDFSGSEDPVSHERASKLAEIDGLYPRIIDVGQISVYRAEFQSTYPTYLRMYHSFSDIWRGLRNLHDRLLDAAKTEGLDSTLVSHLSDQLDALMQRAKTKKYREDEIQLTLMAHKLRLLKQRLVDARHTFQHQYNDTSTRPSTFIESKTTEQNSTKSRINKQSPIGANNDHTRLLTRCKQPSRLGDGRSAVCGSHSNSTFMSDQLNTDPDNVHSLFSNEESAV